MIATLLAAGATAPARAGFLGIGAPALPTNIGRVGPVYMSDRAFQRLSRIRFYEHAVELLETRTGRMLELRTVEARDEWQVVGELGDVAGEGTTPREAVEMAGYVL